MDSHDICELISGLASRANNLSVATTGQTSRMLLAQQDKLSNLALAAIAMDLDATTQQFADTVKVLKEATTAADAAAKQIQQVTQAIGTIATAITKASSLLATA